MPTDSLFTSRRRRAAFLAIGLSAFLATLPSSAQSPSELREQRKEVQAQAAEVALEVEALTDDVESLEEAIEAIQQSVDAQQSAVDAAARAVRDAEHERNQALTAIAELEAAQLRARRDLQTAAVESYVSFQGFDDIDVFGTDPWAAARSESLVEFGTGTGLEIIDDLRVIASDLDFQRKRADAAAADAAALQADAEARRRDLELALASQEEFLAQVDLRLETRYAEVVALESLDASLAEEIRTAEQRIADAIATRPPSGGSVVIPPDADIELTSVRGITVNVLIAEPLEGLLAEMAAEGFTLGGGGYRSTESQIILRRAHCGTSDYAIWEMPARQCRPPTARPGLSQHELGLAVDFTYQGSVLRSRSTAVFEALSRIAPKWGFFNLPSEPWHWSTTGR